jgi:drug/metabolite transporter (DMT)-like permease
LLGIVLSLSSAALSSGKDLVSKHLSSAVSSRVSAFASFAYALPFYVVLLIVLWLLRFETFQFSSAFINFVLLRACTDTAAEWLKMAAIRIGDISLVSCFFTLSPFFLLFTSPLITGDPLSSVAIIATLFIVAGSVIAAYEPQPLLARTASDVTAPKRAISSQSIRAIIFSLLSSLFFSLNSCFDRRAVLEASPTLSAFAMTLIAAAFLAPFALPFAVSRRELWRERSPFLWRGLLEVSFMVSKLWALRYLSAPVVAGTLRISVFFSIVGGRVLYRETQTTQRFIGALITLVGIIAILFTK